MSAALFRPFSFKSLHLKNRIVMAPLTRAFSPDGVVTDDMAAYYRRRAEGEVGLIITEGTGVARPAALNHKDNGGKCTGIFRSNFVLMPSRVAPRLSPLPIFSLRDNEITTRTEVGRSDSEDDLGTQLGASCLNLQEN